MPFQTFKNLSQEKQKKILEAAIKEFSAVSYEKASINKVIKEAGISRGSFYQYFEDKYDLAMYLIDQTREYIMKEAKDINLKSSGQLDKFIVGLHNVLIEYYLQDKYRNFYKNIIVYYHGRPNSEKKSIKNKFLMSRDSDLLVRIMDKSQFRKQDDEFIKNTINLAILILRNTIFQTFMFNLTNEQSNELLIQQLNILKQGYGRM